MKWKKKYNKGDEFMTFTQNFTAVGDNLALSAIVAVIPILYFFLGACH